MSNDRISYLETIFRAIPNMSDFEKGRLLGIAEEMQRQSAQKARMDRYQEALSGLSLKEESDYSIPVEDIPQ